MKLRHLILTTILPLLLPACTSDSEDEPGGEPGSDVAIEFDTPYISKISRADEAASADEIPFSAFKVWGFVNKADSYIFDGSKVSRNSGGEWVCDRQEYWYPGALYFFTGLAPADSKGLTFTPVAKCNATLLGGGTISYDIAPDNAREDLLYAFSGTIKTPQNIQIYAPKVEMEFTHLLSQISFTFHNDLLNPHYFINIHSIMLCNVSSKGSINMSKRDAQWTRDGWESAWIGIDPIYILRQGTPMQTNPVCVIPLSTEGWSIETRVQVFYTPEPYGTVGNPVTDEHVITTDFPDIDLQPGRAYNLICHFTGSNVEGDGSILQPISFSVNDATWRYPHHYDVEVP